MKRNSRWKEWGKNLLILLLSVSAVYLLTLTPLVQDSGVLEFFTPGENNGGDVTNVTLTAAARPSRMAVNTGSGRYAVQYDQAETDELFAYFGPLLGEALSSAEEPINITESLWRRYLQNKGIYFDFSGDIPLSALGGWLYQTGDCILGETARRVVLVSDSDDRVLLCYQNAENKDFRMCRTGLSFSLHLAPAISSIAGNDAVFAYESEEWSQVIHPYTLITESYMRQNYSASMPLAVAGNLSRVLEALDYTGRNHASVSGGELYLDGSDRLQVLTGGRITFDAAQEGKYTVATTGDTATVAEAIEAARGLAERTIGLLCGEAELYLISAETAENGYCIRFGYRLDGSTVWLYDEGWAAEFYVERNCLTKFSLYFRSYTATGTDALLLPMDKAAVMLPGLTDERLELVLQYRDRGENTVKPSWVAQ